MCVCMYVEKSEDLHTLLLIVTKRREKRRKKRRTPAAPLSIGFGGAFIPHLLSS